MWLLAKAGVPLCAGTAASAPWWWSQIAYHERRLEGIAELAALDKNQELPPKSFWFSGARKELDAWIDERKRKDD